MNCRKWKLVAVGLALLCGACVRPSGTMPSVSSPTAVPIGPAILSSATPMSVAPPVLVVPAMPSCPPMEPSSGSYCDKEVLLAARDALRGANTAVLRTWQPDNPIGSFEGIRVHPSSGRVVAIEDDWPAFLTGSIPKSLGQLDQLQVLDLGGNGLTGTIPEELGQLGHLQELSLGRNLLTGPIPSQLGQFGRLRVLNLTDNRLTGAVPSALGQLSHLQSLDLSHNQLTGTIPPELGQLGQLQNLDLSHNQLTGTISPELGRLSQLQVLGLGINQLTGTIPPELGQLGQLQNLDLSHNQLTGTFPPELGQLNQLQRLNLRSNQLTCGIPPALEHLDQLEWLSLGGNQLTGPIPSQLGQLHQLQSLDLSHNQLTGPIPPQLGQLNQLQSLDLRRNQLTGTIPPQLGQLDQLLGLGLSHNLLTGSIPESLGQLLQLWELNVTGNRLTDATSPKPGRVNQLGVPPAAGVYADQTEHWGGQYRVLHQGRQVTVTLATHRSRVVNGEPPQLLFRLSEGYRPILPVTWATVAWPMTAQGRSRPEAAPATVILEARPDGTVHHVDAPTLDGAGYVGYRTAMTWVTNKAALQLFMAGSFTPPADAGTYRLMRHGNTVTATLASPAADRATAELAPFLFTVPVGFRPVEEVTWTVPVTALIPTGVSASGSEPREASGSAFDLRVNRDGTVVHMDPPAPTGYVTTAVWHTADPGWMEVRKSYAPAGNEGTGTYTLRRDGTRVTATVTGAHEVPLTSVLFTVPAGFRPAQTVSQSMAVDTAGCHTRTLKVRPQGTVHLVGRPMEAGDEPLVYGTTMTWTTGADVCQRHPWVQARLLRALRNQGLVRDSCAEVTWTDLASVESLNLNPTTTLRAWLESTLPLQIHDLAGLTGLTTLDLQGDAWFPTVPADLLIQTPALESLDLSGSHLRLPPGFLAHAPGLRQLTLRDMEPEVPASPLELPTGLLAPMPELQDLTLEVPASQAELPQDLLAHVPELRHLTLKGAGLTELPPDLLAHVPELRALTLETPELRELPADLLAPTTVMEHLILKTAGLKELPPNFLVHTPHLQCLILEAAGLSTLPPEFQTRLHEIQGLGACT